MMGVDVVIPLHNKANFVEQAVQSALGQTLKPRRIIVSDDSSRDDGPDRVEALAGKHSEVELLRSTAESSTGPGPTRNRAIACSSADFVAFLDADDWWEPTKLQEQVPLFADPDVGLVHCACNYLGEKDELLFVLRPSPVPAPQNLYDSVRLGTYWVTGSSSAVVVRRSVWDKTSGFPDTRKGEDWRAWVSCAEHSNFAAVQEPLVNYRTTRKIASRADELMFWLRSMEEWQNDPRFSELAVARGRALAVWPQFEALRRRGESAALRERIRLEGGSIGRRLFPDAVQYYSNFARLPFRFVEIVHSRLRRL